jgi:hypothetical protein
VRGESLPVGDPWLGPVYQVLVRKVDLGYYSADRAFLARGIPAVFVSQFSLTRSYPNQGSMTDTLDQISSEQVGSAGRAVEAALTDLASAESLPVGEQQYLVLVPPFGRRLPADHRSDQAPRLSFAPAGRLPASGSGPGDGTPVGRRPLRDVRHPVRRRDDPARPALFPALFLPALLASPLLVVRRPAAVAGHIAAYIPVLLFATLIAPVYLTGSSRFVKVTPPSSRSWEGWRCSG